MRILIDECLPHTLKTNYKGHAVSTVEEEGWKGLVNGKLLAKAVTKFDFMITVDKRISDQFKSIPKIGIVILQSQTNKIEDLANVAKKSRRFLKRKNIGKVIKVKV